jgi:hypothetical protein
MLIGKKEVREKKMRSFKLDSYEASAEHSLLDAINALGSFPEAEGRGEETSGSIRSRAKIDTVHLLRQLFIFPEFVGEWITQDRTDLSGYTLSLVAKKGDLWNAISMDKDGFALCNIVVNEGYLPDSTMPLASIVEFNKRYFGKGMKLEESARYYKMGWNGISHHGEYSGLNGSGFSSFERNVWKNVPIAESVLTQMYMENLKELR